MAMNTTEYRNRMQMQRNSLRVEMHHGVRGMHTYALFKMVRYGYSVDGMVVAKITKCGEWIL